MTELHALPRFQLWRRSLIAGLWSGLISLGGMIITAVAFPFGAYGLSEDILMSFGGGFAVIYHLTLGMFMHGGRLLVIPLTALLWFVIGVVATRFSKSSRMAMGIWLSIYLLCVLLTFLVLIFGGF